MKAQPLYYRIFQMTAIGLLAGTTVSLLLMALDISPPAVAGALLVGTFGSWAKMSHVLALWVPLLLCSSGLLLTFRSGLWNIGIEGQVIVGAIATTALLRLGSPSLPPHVLLWASLFAGLIGGGLWGCLAGILRIRGGVNEIFGGLGLNFVAQGGILWLIFGPWKREGIASMSGTDLFARELWLATPAGWRVAPAALILALLAFFLTALLLGRTRLGLQLKAAGRNPRAARLFAIRPERIGLLAMLLGGGVAGLAGSLQVTGVYHRLLPSISSGYGYLALLIVMLAGYRATAVPALALFFAALAGAAIQLPIVLQIDSSLSGVIQGTLVLSALAVHGLRQHKEAA